MQEEWLLKLGALLLLIGFGWFVSYAFLHDWIGPAGRIALGLIAGAIILVLGWWRIKKYLHQGGVFLVLGSTIILLTTFAEQRLYDFFSQELALGIMFLSVVFVAYVSVLYKSRNLAFASLVLAGIAPLLTETPAADVTELFLYLMIVLVGVLWVVALTGHRELIVASLVLVVLYSMWHLIGFLSPDQDTVLLFVYAFSAIFFIAHML